MKTCTTCQKSFLVSEDEINFIAKVSPEIGGKKFVIPEPSDCPDCRLRLRMVNRNEENFFHTKSAVSGQTLISLYAPDSPYKVVSHEEWWSENWDGISFGQDFDFNRSFFEQFHELDLKIPRVNLVQLNNENSPYSTGTAYCKNCYLINCSENDEDCFYGKLIQTSRNITDSAYVYDSELLYGCFNVTNCYNSQYLIYSQNCRDCAFSDNLRGCNNCFLCTNLDKKEYCFRNEQLTKEEYEKRVQEFLGSHSNVEKAKNLLNEIRKNRVYKYANIVNCENSTGDFLNGCKECFDCFEVNNSQDCRYVIVGVDVKDMYDCNNVYLKPELCYQLMGTIAAYNTIFSTYIFHSQDVIYSAFCFNSKNLLGCVGLRNKQYCIFNKQLTKEEYEELAPRVLEYMQKNGEWGKMPPEKFAPFAYNDSVAQSYLPLTKEEALAKGYKWRESDPKEYKPQTYVIPEKTVEIKDDILNEILACENCRKNYKIIPQELKQIREMDLSIPRKCFACRHTERMKYMNPRKLFPRNCMKCQAPVQSTFASDSPETIYCDKCYVQAIY